MPGQEPLGDRGATGQGLHASTLDPAKAEKKLILDVKHTIYGLTVAPKFQENGYLYLSEMPDTNKEAPDGTKLVRYTVDRTTMTADPTTAKLIFTWPSSGHNGGCMRFGPDGTLYISTGDGSGIIDGLQTGQNISTPLGKILRIDVDKEKKVARLRDSEGQPVREDEGRSRRNLGVWHSPMRGRSVSTPRPATCEAGEVGQDLWEIDLPHSRRAATTAGA